MHPRIGRTRLATGKPQCSRSRFSTKLEILEPKTYTIWLTHSSKLVHRNSRFVFPCSKHVPRCSRFVFPCSKLISLRSKHVHRCSKFVLPSSKHVHRRSRRCHRHSKIFFSLIQICFSPLRQVPQSHCRCSTILSRNFQGAGTLRTEIGVRAFRGLPTPV